MIGTTVTATRAAIVRVATAAAVAVDADGAPSSPRIESRVRSDRRATDATRSGTATDGGMQ